jgi:hypothetical protein
MVFPNVSPKAVLAAGAALVLGGGGVGFWLHAHPTVQRDGNPAERRDQRGRPLRLLPLRIAAMDLDCHSGGASRQ